jgi:hypothetical protein
MIMKFADARGSSVNIAGGIGARPRRGALAARVLRERLR